MTTDVAIRESQSIALRHELSIEDLVAQVQKIQAAMKAVMTEGDHFGIIPGTGTKPTLLKPGAEKLCLLFRLDPQYESTETYDGMHLTIKSRCTLWHIPTSLRMGSGEGSCSTKESKYAYRKRQRKCLKCGSDAIIKGRAEYGGGWLCFAKKGGCGAKYKDGDVAIEGQSTERVANEDLADQYNTVLKMANKRSLVAAVLNVTAASDIFTQDVEDLTSVPHDPEVIEVKDAAEAGPKIDGAAVRASLLDEAKAIANRLKQSAKVRADLWEKHCPGAGPDNVDVSALDDLVGELRAMEAKASS